MAQAEFDTVIVGAGIAGLSCAARLRQLGHECIIIDRSKGVGGRMATRRWGEQRIDHGVGFVHGSDSNLHALLEDIPGAIRWPVNVKGQGRPCQPRAFQPGEWRFAFADGMTALSRQLIASHQLDVRLGHDALRLTPCGGEIDVQTTAGNLHAKRLVLAMAHPQSLKLLRAMPAERATKGADALLSTVTSMPCLTAIASYDLRHAPDWDVCYPEDSAILQTIIHDSAKRTGPKQLVLVGQCLPRWSYQHLGNEPNTWGPLVLAEMQRIVGSFCSAPSQTQFHRWRYARVGRESELAGPLTLRLENGARIDLIGELFAPGGGVEAAYRSGRLLADQLVRV